MARRWGWVMALAAVLAAGGRGHAAELLFQAEAQTLTGVCANNPVRLEGNHNTVSLTGVCSSLLVKGLANTVRLTIASGASIHVEGADNQVHYGVAGAAPAIVTLGPNNAVTPGTERPAAVLPPPLPIAPVTAPAPKIPAPPPTLVTASKGPLELAGDDQERLADCAGRDVVITGNRSAYVVRGVCRSVAVRGDLLTVQAVVQPGARISVNGLGSVVSWAMQGRGHAPASIVQGAGSRVQRAVAIGGEAVAADPVSRSGAAASVGKAGKPQSRPARSSPAETKTSHTPR